MNKSSDTLYKLADSPADFRGAHALMREQGRGDEEVTFSWPTVVACEDDEIIGAIGTIPRKDMIQAGPFVLKPGRRYVALRLMEVYEGLLQIMGISTYTIFVYYSDEKLMEVLLRLPATEILVEDEDGVLFARRLKNGR